jgi:glycosyltransferase involved in cell wall biosynthesis
MSKNYKFSIVIAIYNMEHYLKEAMDSLLHQTIGFEDNLQVLFVNDGSVDGSEAICLSYAQRYPDNIRYLYQENGGVSSARNKGMEYATGELVNFLDADDKLAKDALEKVYEFYTNHKEEVDLISIPLHFFEGEEGEHLLNYKFERTRVIHIFDEPKCFQMHISSSFIRLPVIKKYSFETNLKFGEDAQVANKIILDKGKYGVVADTIYLYRKRNTGSSVIQGARTNKNNYIPPLKYLHLGLIEFAKKRYNMIPEYLQRMLIYDLGWKIRVPMIESSVLNQEEIEEFLGYVKQILEFIDDDIILAGFNTQRFYNLYLLQIKYEKFPQEKLKLISNKEDAIICYEDSIVDMLYKQVININEINIENNRLRLVGSFCSLFQPFDLQLIMEINGIEKEISLCQNGNYPITSLNKIIVEGYDFIEEILLINKETAIKVKAKVGNVKTNIKISLKKDETDNSTIKFANSEEDQYNIEYKNKSLVIKKETITSSNTNKNRIIGDTKRYKRAGSSHKLHIKNIVLKGWIKGKNVLLKIYSNKATDYKIVTTYNQACMYQKEQRLIAKLTDTVISITKCKLNQNILELSGTIGTAFQSKRYSLICLCNNKKFQCVPKEKDKSFQVQIPLSKENEIYFSIMLREANVLTQLKLDGRELEEAVKETDYKVNIVDKQKLMLFY